MREHKFIPRRRRLQMQQRILSCFKQPVRTVQPKLPDLSRKRFVLPILQTKCLDLCRRLSVQHRICFRCQLQLRERDLPQHMCQLFWSRKQPVHFLQVECLPQLRSLLLLSRLLHGLQRKLLALFEHLQHLLTVSDLLYFL